MYKVVLLVISCIVGVTLAYPPSYYGRSYDYDYRSPYGYSYSSYNLQSPYYNNYYQSYPYYDSYYGVDYDYNYPSYGYGGYGRGYGGYSNYGYRSYDYPRYL